LPTQRQGVAGRTIAVALASALLFAACGAGGGITVRDPWIRLTDPSRPLGGFMTIVNDGTAEDALVGAESPAFGKIELHETVPAPSGSPMASDGQMGGHMGSPMASGEMASPAPGGGEAMTMRPVDAIPIPARGEQVLRPGGYHLMLMEPTRALAVGDVVTLTLRFRSGRSLTVEVPVRAP
jgi:copper(I)-binding protein